jgi:hypothetical protein
VSTKAVQRAMRQLGAATRTARERAGYPARVEQWAAAYSEGSTTAEVAAQNGVSEQTVRQRLRHQGSAVLLVGDVCQDRDNPHAPPGNVRRHCLQPVGVTIGQH